MTSTPRFPLLLCCLCSLLMTVPGKLFAQQAGDQTLATPERLFHIERSKNTNLVCYDFQLVDGKLDAKKPLSVYWVVREEGPAKIENLSAIQRRMAYGYKVVSTGDDTAEVTLTAYSGRTLTIKRLNGKYVCLININGKPAILHHLYVKAKESNSMSVEYIELFGTTPDTHTTVSEKIQK